MCDIKYIDKNIKILEHLNMGTSIVGILREVVI